ncbi:MAG: hypothetical protein NZ825_04055 [Candidatus Marinimicrobia bacterium]|nr:hypothetical protein [Candidatus Neomarinimicrobiota bacterium]
MKNLLLCIALDFITMCENPQKSNGFATGSKDSWKIGSQSGVNLVTELDKAWSSRDFEKMKIFFDDSATFMFAEGDKFNSVDGFIGHVKKQFGDQEANWTYDWAVAVDLLPGEGGEWVNAGFTSDVSKTKEDTSKIHYSEWYYVEDGKIKIWNQTRRIILDK